jgi:hypothetical protein
MPNGLPGDHYGKDFKNAYQARLVPRLEAEILGFVNEINNQENGAAYIVSQKVPIRTDYQSAIAELQAESTQGAYSEAMAESKQLFKDAGIKTPPLSEDDLILLNAVRDTAFTDLGQQAALDATSIWKSLVSYTVTGNMKSLEEKVLANLESSKVAQHGTTIINTNIDTFYRTVNGVRGTAAGVTRWRYGGPPPEREFCNGIYKQTFTIEEINLMDNGQLGDVFFTGGGYNCRHYWIPVLD